MAIPTIGFIGLGAMGSGMARNLLKADYSLTVTDLQREKVGALVEHGATAAQHISDLVQANDVILTSVPSFVVAVQVAHDLLNHARPGQIFIELSTMTPTQAQELAAAYAERGATRLDVPVSGGATGAANGTLRMFVGGDEAVVRQCWPIFEVLGDPDRIVYGGPAGYGQIIKVVNQMAMGLSNAIYLETIGFGVKMGLDPDLLVQAVGGGDGWRRQFEGIAHRIKNDQAIHTDVKFVQLQQFADDAAARGYAMPLVQALFAFMEPGERISQEEIYPAPSFWHELMKAQDLD